MCLQSNTNRGFVDLLYATVNGLTINGYVDTYLIHPLFSKLVTTALFLNDDLLLLMLMCSGSVLIRHIVTILNNIYYVLLICHQFTFI